MYVVSGPSSPSSSSCDTIAKRPAYGPMPTWTLIGAPTSRASCQSCLTTSGVQKPGPRVPIASVSRPSSFEKYCDRTRRMSPGDSSVLSYHQSASDVFGFP